MKRLIDSDPMTRQKQLAHIEHDGSLGIETKQDVEDLIERNKAEYRESDNGWDGDFHKVASIPNAVYWDLKRKGIIDDPKAFKKWLNKRENRFFRTKPGRV